MNLSTDRTNEIKRVSRRSKDQITRRIKADAVLMMWKIHFGFYRNVGSHLMKIGRYSHDRNPGNLFLGIAEFESFAEHVLTRPVLMRHRFIDDRNRLRLFVVGGFETASTNNWNAHRFQVTGRDLAMIRIVSEAAEFGI